MAAFTVFFLSFPLPSLLFSPIFSYSSRVSLLSVSLSAMGYSAALAAVSPSADLGRLLPLWLLLAVSPVPRLWRWLSSLCPCFSPSSLCYGSTLRGLLSSVLALRLLFVRLLAVAVCPSLCLAVMISAACALCPLSVLLSLAAGWPYVQANSVWSICTKTPLQIWLLFKVKAGKF